MPPTHQNVELDVDAKMLTFYSMTKIFVPAAAATVTEALEIIANSGKAPIVRSQAMDKLNRIHDDVLEVVLDSKSD